MRRERQVLLLMISTAATIVGLAFLGVVWFSADDEGVPRVDPFGSYPTWTIGATDFGRVDREVIDGRERAVVPVQATTVQAEGVKCLADGEPPTPVFYDRVWRVVGSEGFEVPDSSGVETRAPACQSFALITAIPVEVREHALVRFDAGESFVLVQLTGTESPLDLDGQVAEGAAVQTWQTETFALVPERKPTG